MEKNFYLVLDVETANSTEDALVYDLGFAVVDKKGNIYHSDSLVIYDIFFDEADLMQSAYYAEKLPQYYEGIENKSWRIVRFQTARRIIADLIKKYNVKAVCAYNANFDVTALNTTERFLTSSKYRYFLPYGTEIYCIWHMACQLLCARPTYIKWALQNGKVSPAGNIQTSAEAVYAYISHNRDFEECHTGLKDVLIEAEILAKCFAQHKPCKKNINRACWQIPKKKRKELGL